MRKRPRDERARGQLGRSRALAVLVALVLLAPALVQASAQEGADARCEAPERVEGVGWACVVDDHLYQLVDPETGEPGAYTHGTDSIKKNDGLSVSTTIEPAPVGCNEAPYDTDGEYYAKVYYAIASDEDNDRFTEVKDDLRDLTKKGNRFVVDGGQVTGNLSKVAVQCLDGTITVEKLELPGTRARYEDLGNIFTDMEEMGFTSVEVKHWVFYDDFKDPDVCRGLGELWLDDSDSVGNANNGNRETTNVMEGCLPADPGWDDGVARVWIHELTHNMGAIQTSAPNSDDNFHCTDGDDVMCRSSRSGVSSVCSTLRYDCNKDDYFHTQPPDGSYLDTHWNIGSKINRFLRFNDTTPPSKVTGLAVTDVGQTSLNLSWDPATDNVGVDHYTVYRGTTASDLAPVANTTETRFPDTGLAEDTTYHYEVSAVDAAGNEGERSDTVSTTTDGTPPSQVTGLAAHDVLNHELSLDWDPATDDNTGVDHYEVHRGPDAGNLTQIATTPDPGYHDTGLDLGTTYVYEVSAVDAAGNEGERSESLQVTTTADTTAPRIALDHPLDGWLYNGCLPRGPSGTDGPVFVERGCAIGTIRDDGSDDLGITEIRIELWGFDRATDFEQVVYEQSFSSQKTVSIATSFSFLRGDFLVPQVLQDDYTMKVFAEDAPGNVRELTIDDVTAVDAR